MRLDHTLFFTFVSDTSRHGHIYKLYNQHAPRRVRVQSFGICIMNELNNLPRWYVVASVWDPYQKYNSERVQLRAERFVNSRYSRYSSVSDMLDVLGWLPFSQRRYEARLILFYQIINGLAKCPSNASLLRRIRILEEIIRSGSNDSRLHVMEPPRRRSFIWKIGVNSSIQDQHPF